MDTKSVILKDDVAHTEDSLTESEQIWQFAGRYYHLFLRKKFLILLFCFLGAAAGLTYALLKKKVYVAEVKFTSNVDNDNSGGYLNLAQQFGLINGGGSNGAFSGDNLMELMKTPSLINKTLFTPVVIQQHSRLLFDYYLQSKKLRESWREDKPALASAVFNPDLSKPDYLRDSVLKALHKGITDELVIDKTDKELDFISVTMTDEDSVIAKLFTETLVKTVTDYYVAIITAKYQENVNVLQAKADSLNHNFGQRLSSIASAEDINVNPARRISNVPIQKQQMSAQVDNAVYQEVIKNLELSKIQLQKQTPFIQIVETPGYPLEEIKASKSISMIIGFIAGAVLIIFFLFARTELVKLFGKLKQYENT